MPSPRATFSNSFTRWRSWKLKRKVLACMFGALTLADCRQDMHDQPRYKPFAETDFFGDGRSERPFIEGTVARDQLRLDQARYTGKIGDKDADMFPFPITRADL